MEDNNGKKPIKITSDLAVLLLIIIVFYFYVFGQLFQGFKYVEAEEKWRNEFLLDRIDVHKKNN